MKQEKRQKKGIITYFGLCLGDSIEIECKLQDHSFKKIIHSGEAFMIDLTDQLSRKSTRSAAHFSAHLVNARQ